MRTVVVSDIHLGLRAGNDVARRPEVRARLVDVLAGADRLVLLGDILELRERSLEEALRLARPLLEEAAGVLGSGEIVLVPGNHDHALVSLLRSAEGSRRLHSLEHRLRPPHDHRLGRLATDLAPVRFELAYPGLWLDRGVYAIHGHYMDVHSPIPMVECLALAISARLRGGPPGPGSVAADYERIVAPVYGLSRRIGRGQSLGRGGAGDISVRLYERLTRQARAAEEDDRVGSGGDGAAPPPGSATPAPSAAPPTAAAPRRRGGSPAGLGDRLLSRGVPVAVDVLNRLGLGPFEADISGSALRRAGLVAMGEVVERLGIEADHVIFGHTHRPGPLPHDLDEWTLPARGRGAPTRLMNTGSWVYNPLFLGARASDSPYWPGRCVIVEEGRAPELIHPLADAGHEQLARAV